MSWSRSHDSAEEREKEMPSIMTGSHMSSIVIGSQKPSGTSASIVNASTSFKTMQFEQIHGIPGRWCERLCELKSVNSMNSFLEQDCGGDENFYSAHHMKNFT